MRWLPERPRVLSAYESLIFIIALSGVLAFFSSLISDKDLPLANEILFRVFPCIAFAFCGTCLFDVLATRDRFELACARTALILSFTAVFGCFAVALGAWTRAVDSSILTPHNAMISILSGGVLPYHAGLEALVRFFPLCAALGLCVLTWRRVKVMRSIAHAAMWYIVASGVLYSDSWIAGITVFC